MEKTCTCKVSFNKVSIQFMKKDSATAILRNFWMITAVVIIVAVFMSINWYYYRQIRDGLDREFSIRLQSLASLVSASVDPAELNDMMGNFDIIGPAGPVPDAFRKFSADFSLSNIAIIREDGMTLLSLSPELFPPGEIYPLWNMDYPEIIRALDGTPSATGLVRSHDGNYFKAGYAPIPPGSGASDFVTAVEANAEFLIGLGGLRNILLAATSLSIVGLLLFIWFVIKATSSLIRTRESLLHSETLASMGQMAAGIAHEIRNPLFIIRSSAEKLREAYPERSDEIDEFIIEETDRLNRILTDYLMFAKNEATGRSVCDLVTILGRCIRLMDEATEPGQLPITFLYKATETPLMCEEKRIQQAFLNILINARQASTGDQKIEVTFFAKTTGYTITFTDHGTGISRKDIEKAFEPFYTTKQTGSGLGLAIAKNIIEDHGGSIIIDGITGKGSTVTITLPFSGTVAGVDNEQSNYSR